MNELIYFKVFGTLVILWMLTMFCAYPTTAFAEWGKRKCGSYERFMNRLFMSFAIPFVILGIIWLWTI
jgi:hypothetical protein